MKQVIFLIMLISSLLHITILSQTTAFEPVTIKRVQQTYAYNENSKGYETTYDWQPYGIHRGGRLYANINGVEFTEYRTYYEFDIDVEDGYRIASMNFILQRTVPTQLCSGSRTHNFTATRTTNISSSSTADYVWGRINAGTTMGSSSSSSVDITNYFSNQGGIVKVGVKS
ncbi:MAG: hypothetical protein KKF62_01315 [Bacteroidetes bacterium]|nr:hypothetical protein [Bacteroidota bacterium]MBU1115145.1 hypothetical protein [Bacteroidota bacterium]MBU1799316.1 hypothetical protein [Bacteroidota bacterium]